MVASWWQRRDLERTCGDVTSLRGDLVLFLRVSKISTLRWNFMGRNAVAARDVCRSTTQYCHAANDRTTPRLPVYYLEKGFGHDRRVMVSDFPLAILIVVEIRVASLDLVTGRTHGEFINASIQGPVVSLDNLAFEQYALRFLLKKVNKVGLDRVIIHAGSIRDGWKKDCILGVTLGNSIGIQRGKRKIPEQEEIIHFLVRHATSRDALEALELVPGGGTKCRSRSHCILVGKERRGGQSAGSGLGDQGLSSVGSERHIALFQASSKSATSGQVKHSY